jgi:hypothetical protein
MPLARRLLRMRIADVTALQPGWTVEVENVTKTEVRRAAVRDEGRFAVHVRCDWDDRLAVTIRDRAGSAVDRIDTFREDAWFWQTAAPTYREGEPIRSPAEGWGMHRGSPDLRRLFGIAQMVMDPGDPLSFYPHYLLDPLPIRPDGGKPSNILVIATLGDPMDPIDVHGTVGRAAGLLKYADGDRYAGTPPYATRDGMFVNDWLIANGVIEGICAYDRFPPRPDGSDVLFDPDCLDDLGLPGGQDGNGFDAPRPPPGQELRLTVTTPAGQSGIRFAHMKPCGKHSFFVSDPSNAFNADEYLTSLVGYWFRTGGRQILDDRCHADSSCPLPPKAW